MKSEPTLTGITAPQIIVERYPSEKEWTLSDFFINGKKSGVGVEDEYRLEKVKGETRIPNGIYELGLRDSPKFSSSYFVDEHGNLNQTKTDRFNKPHQLIWVLNVPNFEFVLWHWGNSDLDTDGCYIVGSYIGNIEVVKGGVKETRKGVVSSRVKYVEIYPIIWNMIASGQKIHVQYKDKSQAA